MTEPGRGGGDFWLVKVNRLGVLRWQHRYGGLGHDWLASARPTPDGGYVLVGTTTSGIGGEVSEPSRGSRDLWVVKVDSLGILQWQHRYGGSGSEYAAAVEVDPDGGYALGASTTSPVSGEVSQPSRGGTDYWLLRLSAQGTVLWDQRLGGSGEDVLTSLALTKGYGYALGGQSNSPTASGEHQQANRGGYDYWTLVLGGRRVPAPVILSFTPGLGLPGTVVTLTGTGFTGTSSVAFNGTVVPGFVVSNGGTTITVTLPAGATTGLVAVTANGTGVSTTPFVVPGDLVISTAQAVQGTYRNVTVTGPATGGAGVGTLSGPLTVLGTLLVADGGTLHTACQPLTGPGNFTLAAGGTLGICDPAGISTAGPTGAVQLAGTRSFSADALYVYEGTQAQVTGPSLPAQVRTLTVDNPAGLALTQTVAIAQVLRMSIGDLTTNGQGLILRSSAAGTALVDNTGGVVLGAATVERFVDPTRNPGRGYRHFAAPIATATVASLTTPGFAPTVNPAYNTSATPGTLTPFPTVYGYDQRRLATSPATGFSFFDRGWVSPTQLTDPLAVGRGYTVNLPAGLTVAFTGPLNNGPVSLPLDRGGNPALETGWHLVGNPYPSPLDWSLLTLPSTLDNALYVFESSGAYTGQYRSYVNGFGASPVLGSGQGAFVRVNAVGATPTLAFTNAARLTTFGTEPVFGRGVADTRPRVQLELGDAAGARPTDAAYVYFEAGATTGRDARFDAEKLANPSGLNLAALAGTTALAIDGLPPLGTSLLTVPLEVHVPQSGPYTFTVAELDHFAPGTDVYLLDALTGARQRLTTGTRYACTLTAPAAGRFALEFRPATVTAVAAASGFNLWAYPNPVRGALHVEWTAAWAAGTLTLTDLLGRQVLRQPVSGTGATLSTVHVAPGCYLLQLLGSPVLASPVKILVP